MQRLDISTHPVWSWQRQKPLRRLQDVTGAFLGKKQPQNKMVLNKEPSVISPSTKTTVPGPSGPLPLPTAAADWASCSELRRTYNQSPSAQQQPTYTPADIHPTHLECNSEVIQGCSQRDNDDQDDSYSIIMLSPWSHFRWGVLMQYLCYCRE